MHQSSSVFGFVERLEEPNLDSPALDVLGAENQPVSPARLVLETGREFLINRNDIRYSSWAQLLNRRAASHTPIYIQTDEEGEYVHRIEIPRRRKVEKVFPIPGLNSFGIKIVASPRILYLASDSDALHILKMAEAEGNEVLITADKNTDEVLDVRPLAAKELATNPPNLAILPPNALIQVLTPIQVLNEFRSLANQKHIPFDFPKDCCHARAHEMFRLSSSHGFSCRKIWNYGAAGSTGMPRLTFFTLNDPKGFVQWDHHVAPLVKVQIGNDVAEMVIDPSMFNRPVRIPDWLALQHDTTAIQATEIPEVFERRSDGIVVSDDPFFYRTTDHLKDHIDERDSA